MKTRHNRNQTWYGGAVDSWFTGVLCPPPDEYGAYGVARPVYVPVATWNVAKKPSSQPWKQA